MRILALTRYERLGSSSRVRFYQYFPYLESRGIEITNAPFFGDDYVRNLYAGKRVALGSLLRAYLQRLSMLLTQTPYDLLWVEKEFLPWFPAPLETLFRKQHIPYVVDYDDAVFHRYDLHSSAVIRALLGRKINHVMRNAHIVVAGNEYLRERAIRAGAGRVEILPSVVDVDRYELKQHQQNPTLNIGWIGSPLTARYLDVIRDVMDELQRESPIHLVLVGAGMKSAFEEVSTEVLAWNEDMELHLSRSMDVGIMPLVDEPFERGKCGYKLIQYMAGGIPVVASPVGVNRQIIEHGSTGYLAETRDDWLRALRMLRDDLEKRSAMGWAGHQKAKKLYNLQVTAPVLSDLLTEAARKSST